VTRICLLAVAALTAIALLLIYVRFEHGVAYLYGLAPLFDPAREANVPTWFSASLLLGSAIALAQARGPDRRWWLALAAAFALASLDEVANLHELLSRQARLRLVQPGFSPVWVLFVGPPALAFVAVYARFLARRPPAVRRPFALGAALFLGGALGVEVVEIALERRGSGAVTVALTLLAQEVMELTGAVVLLHGSLTNLRAQ
jgi:hypothetical protein